MDFELVQTNLRVLHKSRKPPQRGDVFVMQLPDESYLFGRVILADMPRTCAPMPGANLIYIYAERSATSVPEHAKLLPGRLLLAPIWTNRLGWTNGYFQTFQNLPLGKFDLLRQHCFFKVPLAPGSAGKYVDESGKEMKQRSEPCGEWSLASYRWIDDRISDALKIPRAA